MTTKRLGELLVTKKLISDEQLNQALAEQESSGTFLGEILVKKGLVREEEAAQSLSEQLGIAYIDLAKYSSDPGIINSLPEEVAKRRLAIPLFRSATLTTVAMANPLDVNVVDELQKIMKVRIRPVFAAASQIYERIRSEYHKSDFTLGAAVFGGAPGADLEQTAAASSNLAVIEIVDELVAKAVACAASDIHLEPQGEHFYCRYRIDGLLQDGSPLPKKYEAAVISRIKILANMDISERRLPQDGRIQTTAGDKKIDLRISTFPTMHGENLVIRILDRTRALLHLEGLGMNPGLLKVFEQIIHRPHGVILVTGPTGSGKSTTLYAILSKINCIEKNIITLEDPIEYEIERVRQSQVNLKAGLTFATGLRSIVRQDPDIIMIGEIRDRETAEIAIHAALTGHLVLSTLHTNDAASAVTRLIDMGIEPFLVSSALICCVAQRLVRVLCPGCKEQWTPPPDMIKDLRVEPGLSLKFYRESGCPECRNTGYAGRIGIYEMLVSDDELKRLIEKKAAASELRDLAVRKGMKTLREDGLEKLARGLTSLSELLRVTHED